MTEKQYQKSKKDGLVFNWTDIFNEMLDNVLQVKGEAKKVNNKIVK